MSRPTTSGEFLDLVRASDVLDVQVLDGFVNQSNVLLAEPIQLARSMIREGVLTAFQAEQFLLGKSRLTLAGKYKILDRLGSGGMSIVLLCEHKHMRRLVALKVLPSQHAREQGCLERFYREARAVAQVHHPNIVTAHDIDQDGKYHFIVLEYVDGSNLQHIVQQHGPMDITRACHYISQAAQGLQHAHEMGLVHRDIKPANLLLDRSGTVKILDLGLARFFHDTIDNLTEKYDSGSVLGTADYLSPDQALNSHGADIRSDIYSLGVTLYFLLAGQTPFADGDTARKLIAQLMRIPKSIRKFRPEVPEELERVLCKMTAKGPDDRYQTPEEVVEALAPWTEEPIDPPPAEEMPKRHSGRHSAGGGDSSSPGSTVTGARAGSVTPRSRPRPSASAKSPRRLSFPTFCGLVAVCLLVGVGLAWMLFPARSKEAPLDGQAAPLASTPVDSKPRSLASNLPIGSKAKPSVPVRVAAIPAGLTWSSYDVRGTLLRDNIAQGASPVFVVPAGTTQIFVTRSFAPLDLGPGQASARVSFSVSVRGGFASGRPRVFGFGLFNSRGTPDQLGDDIGYFTLWNPGGPYFETYARTEGEDLFTGTQLSQGGTYQGLLMDDAAYECQLQLNMNAAGNAIGLGTGNSPRAAGVEVKGPGVAQMCYSNPVSPLVGGVRTFDQFAIRFHNAGRSDVTLSVQGFQVLVSGAH